MNRRMIAAALTCLACTAGLSACSLTGTGDTHHIAVIIKHAGEHFSERHGWRGSLAPASTRM